MRISDWSSDVCSSDLFALRVQHAESGRAVQLVRRERVEIDIKLAHVDRQMGDALCAVDQHGDAARVRSEEHTSELQSLMRNSYAVFCLKKKKNKIITDHENETTTTRVNIIESP